MSALGEPRRIAEAAWDLELVRAGYQTFLDTFSRVRATTPETCFERQTALVHAWRRFLFLDPDLPRELLGRGWPRRSAVELFRDRHARWDTGARAHFEALEASVTAATAA